MPSRVQQTERTGEMIMALLIRGVENSVSTTGKYGIRLRYEGWKINDTVPRVNSLIGALEYFHKNGCGLLEVNESIVVSDQPATQHGATVVPTDNGATLAIVEGDNASVFRDTIIAARDSGVIKDNWIVLNPSGVLLTFTDPTTLPPPREINFSRQQVDYEQRL